MLLENLYLHKKLFFIQPIHHPCDIINPYRISVSHSGCGVFTFNSYLIVIIILTAFAFFLTPLCSSGNVKVRNCGHNKVLYRGKMALSVLFLIYYINPYTQCKI